jgi:hypothetical protein
MNLSGKKRKKKGSETAKSWKMQPEAIQGLLSLANNQTSQPVFHPIWMIDVLHYPKYAFSTFVFDASKIPTQLH